MDRRGIKRKKVLGHDQSPLTSPPLMTMPKLWGGGGGVRASQLNTAHGKKLISASLVERVQEESFESATFKGYQQYMNYSYSVRVLRSPPHPHPHR